MLQFSKYMCNFVLFYDQFLQLRKYMRCIVQTGATQTLENYQLLGWCSKKYTVLGNPFKSFGKLKLWSCEWDETAVKPWRECEREREREECVRERERKKRVGEREREMRRDCEGWNMEGWNMEWERERERELGETVELDSDHLEAQELAGNLQWHMGDLSANQADERVCQALGQWPRPRKPPWLTVDWRPSPGAYPSARLLGMAIAPECNPHTQHKCGDLIQCDFCCYVDQRRMLSKAAPNQRRLRTFGTVKPQRMATSSQAPLQVHIGTSHRALSHTRVLDPVIAHSSYEGDRARSPPARLTSLRREPHWMSSELNGR